jgi:phosphoglycerate kinase
MIDENILKGKNILLRADLDVPIEEGRVVNDFRLKALLSTLQLCLDHAASTLIIGHLGRPEIKSAEFSPSELVERGAESQFSLKPIREWLENALHRPIFFIDSGFSPGEWVRGVNPLAMMDNLRFHPGENSLDRAFAKALSAGSDIYVYEAFAAYNEAASLRKIPEFIPTHTGLQFDREVEELSNIVKSPDRPSLLIISGAKEDKLKFVDNLVDNFDGILIGGKLASLAKASSKVIPATLTPDGLDIDETAIRLFCEKIGKAKSIVLNGPLGKFEDGIHDVGTKAILTAIASSSVRTVIGGGDTLEAIPLLGFSYSDFDFISTGGGAMLEFLATGSHPILDIIKSQTYANT